MNNNGDLKGKLTKTGNEDINITMYGWFLDARSHNLPISEFILQTQAKLVAKTLNKLNN